MRDAQVIAALLAEAGVHVLVEVVVTYRAGEGVVRDGGKMMMMDILGEMIMGTQLGYTPHRSVVTRAAVLAEHGSSHACRKPFRAGVLMWRRGAATDDQVGC